mmetsp:Transcript_88738/g.228897  ORF Transcript_88738/g.228897 Transcript_88738/m.228897 type:complete len:216 (+) Transcript_88738:898-1545(+)
MVLAAVLAGAGTKLCTPTVASGSPILTRGWLASATGVAAADGMLPWARISCTAMSASRHVRPMSAQVLTKCPRRRIACSVGAESKSMSSMTIQRVTSGWRSSHSQISISRGVFSSLVRSLMVGMFHCCSTWLSTLIFATSVRQVLESTMSAPVSRTMCSSTEQQLSRKRSSPKREWRTPSTSRKTTVLKRGRAGGAPAGHGGTYAMAAAARILSN